MNEEEKIRNIQHVLVKEIRFVQSFNINFKDFLLFSGGKLRRKKIDLNGKHKKERTKFCIVRSDVVGQIY